MCSGKILAGHHAFFCRFIPSTCWPPFCTFQSPPPTSSCSSLKHPHDAFAVPYLKQVPLLHPPPPPTLHLSLTWNLAPSIIMGAFLGFFQLTINSQKQAFYESPNPPCLAQHLAHRRCFRRFLATKWMNNSKNKSCPQNLFAAVDLVVPPPS